MRRLLVVLAIVSVLVAGLFVYSADNASALSRTWTSDTDFAGGLATGTEVVGTGAAASIQLGISPLYNWIKPGPANPPPARTGVVMTFDEQNGRIVAFGGELADSSFTNTMWAYNVPANTWTNITPASSPPARWKAGFDYDPVQHAYIMYGGQDAAGWRTDLWWFYLSNTTWVDRTPPPPGPRNMQSTPMAYDNDALRHLMVGTNGVTSTLETWSYNSATNTWSSRSPTGDTPPATSGHSLTYDRSSHRAILFGGASGLTLYGDVYEYDYTNNTWTDTIPWQQNVTPNKRTDHALIFGPNAATDILYGGIDSSSTYQPGTWILIDSGPLKNWQQQMGATEPGPRKNHAMAWDSVHDRVVMFGGMLQDGTVTNETVVWGPGYFPSGQFESAVFDAGCANPTWQNLWWNSTVPFTTTARFKLATSTSPTGPWTFTGPDGAPGTYYNTPGQTIWSGNNIPPQEYFKWKLFMTSGNPQVTPSLDDVGVDYACPVEHPYITSHTPAQGDTGVLTDSTVTVTFSLPMDTSSVVWEFNEPAVNASVTATWTDAPTNKTLVLSHSVPYSECFTEQVQIWGKDKQNGMDLVAGTAPNPWTFQTSCVPPKITNTIPTNGAPSVTVDQNIEVTFSKVMQPTTLAWNITPAIGLTSDYAGVVLRLNHSTPFATCTQYTVEITAGKDLAGLDLVPGTVPNPWTFTTECPNPYIVSTVPDNGAVGIPVAADIVVTFSKPMDMVTVVATITPSVAGAQNNWDPTHTILTVTHTSPFADLTNYSVHVTGNDTAGLPLTPGPVENPWYFWTVGLNPVITLTDPASGAVDVPLTANIVVTFSEPMAGANATISPTLTLTKSWDPTNMILTLSHASPFVSCTVYTVTMTGQDRTGASLGPGPVPNPWSFTTVCPVAGPGHLRVAMAGNDVQLSWDPVAGATEYRIFGNANKFAPWPWTQRGTVTGTTYTAVGDGADGQTHYYIVRAFGGAGESPNSTMGVKVMLAFPHSTVNTNIAWFSLPFSSTYLKASDISGALGPSRIDLVGKWVPSQQRSVVYYFARGQWRGTDFTIAAGDGLFLGTKGAFNWNVTGTDANLALTFTLNGPPKGNVNWISLPWTGNYQRASQIANELGSTKITELGLWNANTQQVDRYYWTGSAWTGTDFAIAPGAGVYFIIASSFSWTPTLVTPAVP